MRPKVQTLEDAARLVKSGDTVVMSANLQRSPMAMLRQLVRQGTHDLRVVGVVGGEINIDFLVGAGAVKIVDTCSVTLGPYARTGPNFQRWAQGGRVKAFDNT